MAGEEFTSFGEKPIDQEELDLFQIGTRKATQKATVQVDAKRRRIRSESWKTLLNEARTDGRKHLDASKEKEFVDLLYRAVHSLDQQGGRPRDECLYHAPEARSFIRDQVNELTRYRRDLADGFESIQFAGYNFELVSSNHLEADEMVLTSENLFSTEPSPYILDLDVSPSMVPIVVLENFPVGVSIRLEVDGVDNDVIVRE